MFDNAKYLVFTVIILLLSTSTIEQTDTGRSTLPVTEFAYGGALYIRMNETAQNDPEITASAKFAMTKLYAHTPSTSGHREADFSITSATISKLLYTEDGQTPFLVRMVDPDTGQPELYPIIWGVVYSLNLSVPHHDGHPVQHSIVVLQYWDGLHYLFQHTFKQQLTMPLRKFGSESQTHCDHVIRGVASERDGELQCHSSSICCSRESCSDVRLHSCKRISIKTEFFCLLRKACDISLNDIKHNQPAGKPTIPRAHPDTFSSSNGTYTLKLLSFNIWNVNVVTGGDAAYIKRIRHIARLCRQTAADVIGLQEVRFQEGQGGSLGPNQMAHLTELLPDYQYVFQPAQVQTHTLPNMSVEGVAFLSKHPITSHDFLFLKMDRRDPADGRQRILQHVEVSLPRVGKVHIFNTHLSLSHKARATSVLQTWDYMNTFTGPAFLMGDWNAEPHNVEVQFLDGRSALRGVHTTGLYDVWRLKHGLDVKGFTFSSIHKQLTKRIDIIFMREHKRVSLKDVWILDDKTRREQAASDHLGLVAEFMIRE